MYQLPSFSLRGIEENIFDLYVNLQSPNIYPFKFVFALFADKGERSKLCTAKGWCLFIHDKACWASEVSCQFDHKKKKSL